MNLQAYKAIPVINKGTDVLRSLLRVSLKDTTVFFFSDTIKGSVCFSAMQRYTQKEWFRLVQNKKDQILVLELQANGALFFLKIEYPLLICALSLMMG